MDISKAIDKKLGAEREVVAIKKKTQSYGYEGNNVYGGDKNRGGIQEVTAPATPEAQLWNGWGTCLKPANEPIVLARKPLSEKTIAENVMKWGTGGLNIDGCRIEHNEKMKTTQRSGRQNAIVMTNSSCGFDNTKDNIASANPKGRFPANVILDEEAGRMLDEQHKGASSFFYCAKASGSERTMGGKVKNNHPTVKPIKLIRYLCRLIAPPGGLILDPFAGSGTTLIAAVEEGFSVIGIEREPEYCEIIRKRMAELQPALCAAVGEVEFIGHGA